VQPFCSCQFCACHLLQICSGDAQKALEVANQLVARSSAPASNGTALYIIFKVCAGLSYRTVLRISHGESSHSLGRVVGWLCLASQYAHATCSSAVCQAPSLLPVPQITDSGRRRRQLLAAGRRQLLGTVTLDAYVKNGNTVTLATGIPATQRIQVAVDGATVLGVPPTVIISQGLVSKPPKVPLQLVSLTITPSAASM
jgi:hypothetical protein